MNVPAPAEPAGPVCESLLSAVQGPAGLPRRPVVGDPTRTAAWGDPPVSLVCGAAVADGLAQQLQVGPPGGDTVSFAIGHDRNATTFTTVGLRVPVRVTVPAAYDSTVLVPLAGALLRADPPIG